MKIATKIALFSFFTDALVAASDVLTEVNCYQAFVSQAIHFYFQYTFDIWKKSSAMAFDCRRDAIPATMGLRTVFTACNITVGTLSNTPIITAPGANVSICGGPQNTLFGNTPMQELNILIPDFSDAKLSLANMLAVCISSTDSRLTQTPYCHERNEKGLAVILISLAALILVLSATIRFARNCGKRREFTDLDKVALDGDDFNAPPKRLCC